MMQNESERTVLVETVQDVHLAAVARIQKNFLNSKHMLCCIPLGVGESETGYKRTYEKHPEKRAVAAVATVNGMVAGFMQMILHGMPCDMHKSKPEEAYVYTIMVEPDFRGMGVGTKLFAWGERTAKERGCTYMSLEVIHGNPATRLYERLGYTIKPSSLGHTIGNFIFSCCFMGFAICPAGSSAYCSYGRLHYMEKPL